jgi:hypothetical protein
MAEIVIKSQVSLAFLGEEYAESYLVFRSIPMREFAELTKQTEALKGDKSMDFIVDQITQRFISGKVSQDGVLVDVSAEDLTQFPPDVYLESFKRLTGQADPKV